MTNNKTEYLVLEKSTGEGSGYAVYKHPENPFYELFSWPMYGGEERFEHCFPTIQECIDEAESWT